MDPGFVSSLELGSNPDYAWVSAIHTPGYDTIVFRHRKTGTYWQGGYPIIKGRGYPNDRCVWHQVQPRPAEVQTEWESVNS